MSVGLPGSGIGGVFYLLSAMWMPVHSAQRTVRGKTTRLRVMLLQTTLALLIIGALWGTGWLIDLVLTAGPTSHAMRAAVGKGGDSSNLPTIFRAATFAMTFGTLALVLLAVQVLRFVVPRRAAAVAPPNADDEPERKAA